MPAYQRSKRMNALAFFAAILFALAPLPIYSFCNSHHICMGGHLHHPPYPIWHYYLDLLWLGLHLLSAIAALFATFRLKVLFLAMLVFMIVTHPYLWSIYIYPLDTYVIMSVSGLVALLFIFGSRSRSAQP